MTTQTKQLEEEFNKALPEIKQAELGSAKPTKFNKADFLKAAQELNRVVRENDKREASRT